MQNPIIYRVLYILGGCLGLLPSTVFNHLEGQLHSLKPPKNRLKNRPSLGNDGIPTIHFQVLLLLVPGRVTMGSKSLKSPANHHLTHLNLDFCLVFVFLFGLAFHGMKITTKIHAFSSLVRSSGFWKEGQWEQKSGDKNHWWCFLVKVFKRYVLVFQRYVFSLVVFFWFSFFKKIYSFRSCWLWF